MWMEYSYSMFNSRNGIKGGNKIEGERKWSGIEMGWIGITMFSLLEWNWLCICLVQWNENEIEMKWWMTKLSLYIKKFNKSKNNNNKLFISLLINKTNKNYY